MKRFDTVPKSAGRPRGSPCQSGHIHETQRHADACNFERERRLSIEQGLPWPPPEQELRAAEELEQFDLVKQLEQMQSEPPLDEV